MLPSLRSTNNGFVTCLVTYTVGTGGLIGRFSVSGCEVCYILRRVPSGLLTMGICTVLYCTALRCTVMYCTVHSLKSGSSLVPPNEPPSPPQGLLGSETGALAVSPSPQPQCSSMRQALIGCGPHTGTSAARQFRRFVPASSRLDACVTCQLGDRQARVARFDLFSLLRFSISIIAIFASLCSSVFVRPRNAARIPEPHPVSLFSRLWYLPRVTFFFVRFRRTG